MITAKEIYSILDSAFPFFTQEKWDNSGLLINSDEGTDVIVCCLDVTLNTVEFAVNKGAKIIVSHHPVIFDGIKSIASGDVVYQLVKNNISVISAHTNFDKYKYGTCYNMAKALELEILDDSFEIGLTASCPEQSTKDFAEKCKSVFGAASYTLGDKSVRNIFICAGSGSGMKDEVIASGADMLLTGECKYHDMLDYSQIGISVVSVGHDLSERISVDTLKALIENETENIQVVSYIENGLVNTL